MNLHFITSISPAYWHSVAKYCIPTWNLPGKVTVYIDQHEGDLNWLNEVPYDKILLQTPPLEIDGSDAERGKVIKFWGKSCAQIHAVLNVEESLERVERIIWLDADIEQIGEAPDSLFNFEFKQDFALMNSDDGKDCWESGLVIFNQEAKKIRSAMKEYRDVWNDPDILHSLWKPYDAQVIGYVAKQRGFVNLCERSCKNVNALSNTRYAKTFKHWINKTNKKILFEKHNENSDLPLNDTK